MEHGSKMTKNVEMLLIAEPTTRDNDGDLSLMYLFHYWNKTKEDFIRDRMPSKIERTRRELQHNNQSLRGKTYNDRQKHAKAKREEYSKHRNQGQYEDCSNIFEPIKIEKENTLQYIIRSIRNIF